MLRLKCLASGSSGNCYLLSTETETLILDCGIPIKEIKKGLGFNLSKVVGCIVTHGHSDHVLSVKDFERMGIDAWMPYLDEQKVQRRYFGGFMARSFDVPHDGCPCVGYVVECPNGERLLYATDFEYIGYLFKKIRLHHMLIEANYQEKYVEKSANNRSHVLRGHAEIKTTAQIVEDNCDSLKTVILCHLSDSNADPYECVAEVQKVAGNGVCVDYARRRLEVDLENGGCPF